MNNLNTKKILLFGGSSALLKIAKEIIKKKYELMIFSETMHLNEEINDFGTLRDNLDKEGLAFSKINELSPKEIEGHITPNTIGLSISAVWIFKQDVIDLFEGRLYNIHASVIPRGKGGGVYTWKILSQDHFGGFSIHKLEAGIDAGDVFMFKEFTFPLTCRIPKDYLAFAQEKEDKLLLAFLDAIESDDDLIPVPQNENFGTYWPRVNTEINGYVNWDWTADEIELFINAFDDPYAGATTFLNGQKLRLKKGFKTQGEASYHPFQYGIVYRIHNGHIFIAAKEGTIVLGEVYADDETEVFDKIKLGDRLYTPHSYLDQARARRIIYNAEGLQNKV